MRTPHSHKAFQKANLLVAVPQGGGVGSCMRMHVQLQILRLPPIFLLPKCIKLSLNLMSLQPPSGLLLSHCRAVIAHIVGRQAIAVLRTCKLRGMQNWCETVNALIRFCFG